MGFEAGVAASIESAPYLTSFPPLLDPSTWPVTVRYRLAEVPPAPLPDWWGASAAPLLYVTFGTVVGHTGLATRVFRDALEAVEGLGARILLTIGRSGEPPSIGSHPANVHVERWVDQASVMAESDAVLCHGGSGTTLGALRAGVPLVICPLYADNARNGSMVERAGAGLVAAAPVRPDDRSSTGVDASSAVRGAVERVLTEASFGSAARRVRDEMASAPLPQDAVASLGAAPTAAW